MSFGPIRNAKDRPLFSPGGTTPDVSGALQDYYQNIQAVKMTKSVVGFQVLETSNPVNFRGVIQPFSDRKLFLLPEGQRAWTWFTLQSDPACTLDVDDVFVLTVINNKPTRVMGRKDYTLYGYLEYTLVQDWKE